MANELISSTQQTQDNAFRLLAQSTNTDVPESQITTALALLKHSVREMKLKVNTTVA